MLRYNRRLKGFTKDLLIVGGCLGAVCLLYQPHLNVSSLGGGDNAEWRDETNERPSLASVFDFRYRSTRHGPSSYFNPVQMLIWKVMLDNFDYETQAIAYRILCLIIHCLNIVMVFLLARALALSRWVAGPATFCFALFFPNFQTVGWVAGCVTTGVSGLFLFCTLYCFVKYFDNRNLVFMLLSYVAYLVGLFTKEFVVFVLPMVLAYYVVVQRPRVWRLRREDTLLLPFGLVTLPMAYIVFQRIGDSAIVNEWGGFSFGIHMGYRFLDLVSYLVTAQQVGLTTNMVCAGFIMAVFPLVWWRARRDQTLMFLLLWFLLAVLVYTFSNFRDIYSLARYLYQPSVPWFLMVCYFLYQLRWWLRLTLYIPLVVGGLGYYVYLITERT
jgi:hypothetical protein